MYAICNYTIDRSFLCMSNMSSVPFFIGDLFKDLANEVTKLKNVCYM